MEQTQNKKIGFKSLLLLLIGLGVAGYFIAGNVSQPEGGSFLASIGTAEPEAKLISEKPLFRPLDKFVISLEGVDSTHYMVLEIALVTHDFQLMEEFDEINPVLRNALVQHFSNHSFEQVKRDLQQVDQLQVDLLAQLQQAVSAYGYNPAIDEVLLTKVVVQ